MAGIWEKLVNKMYYTICSTRLFIPKGGENRILLLTFLVQNMISQKLMTVTTETTTNEWIAERFTGKITYFPVLFRPMASISSM